MCATIFVHPHTNRKQERKLCKGPLTPRLATACLRNSDHQGLDLISIKLLQIRANREPSLVFLGCTAEELFTRMVSHSLFQVPNQGSLASLPQAKMQTQASVLKFSSQWQRRYMGK